MTKPPQRRGFSLVEVSVAIAILSFCLLTLLALLPAGLISTTDSLQKTSAAGIVSQIAADIRDTPPTTNWTSASTLSTSPRYGLTLDTTSTSTAVGSTNTFYLDDTGNPTGAVNTSITTSSIYKATVVTVVPRQSPGGASANNGGYFYSRPTFVRIIVTWPAQEDRTAGALPSHFQGSYESDTAVDRN
jgi:uncharacterized protein (TIGR02598 family)